MYYEVTIDGNSGEQVQADTRRDAVRKAFASAKDVTDNEMRCWSILGKVYIYTFDTRREHEATVRELSIEDVEEL